MYKLKNVTKNTIINYEKELNTRHICAISVIPRSLYENNFFLTRGK